MFHRAGSVLLVLLVLGCLQFHARAQSGAIGPSDCCFGFYKLPIPVKDIKAYAETRPDCSKPGVIFTLTDETRVCARPGDRWVQRHIRTVKARGPSSTE